VTKILIVDPDENEREKLKSFLRADGYDADYFEGLHELVSDLPALDVAGAVIAFADANNFSIILAALEWEQEDDREQHGIELAEINATFRPPFGLIIYSLTDEYDDELRDTRAVPCRYEYAAIKAALAELERQHAALYRNNGNKKI
jgi:hypothetical protein